MFQLILGAIMTEYTQRSLFVLSILLKHPEVQFCPKDVHRHLSKLDS
jgi:hypothetical protein